MNGNDTFLDVNDAHLRVTSGNVYASAFNLDQIDIVMSSNTASTVNFNNPTKAFNAASNIEVGTANLFVDTTTSNVGIGTDTPLDTLHINGGTRFAGHIIPTTNATFDIGEPENKIRDIYVDTNSLWIGDITKIAFERGKMKFKRRKINKVPTALVTLATSHVSELNTEAEVQADAVTFAQTIDNTISTIEDLKLEHWRDYAKRFDETKAVSDIFIDNDEDYEAVTASEAFMEVGSNIFTEHSLSIGKTTDPTSALDVEGDVVIQPESQSVTFADVYNRTYFGFSESLGFSFSTPSRPYGSAATAIYSKRVKYTSTGGLKVSPPDTGNQVYYNLAASRGYYLNFVGYMWDAVLGTGSVASPYLSGDVFSSTRFKNYDQEDFTGFAIGQVYTPGNITGDLYQPVPKLARYHSAHMYFKTASSNGTLTEKMRITNAGNVGIGTTSPTAALDVSGTVKATAFEGDGSALTGIVAGQWTESSGDIYRSSGNVGVGTDSPAKTLHVAGTVRISNTTTNTETADIVKIASTTTTTTTSTPFTGWSQEAEVYASNRSSYDYFGQASAMSGDGSTFVSIARSEDTTASDSGAAYVYTYNGSGGWPQTTMLKASDAASGDILGESGISISHDGTRILVAARNNDDTYTNSGSAYVFDLVSGSWSQTQKLVASNPGDSDHFGRVKISGDGNTIFVGAHAENGPNDALNDSGALYYFTNVNGTWTEQQLIRPSVTNVSDIFGLVIGSSYDGASMVASSRGMNSNRGAAFIFELQNGTYVQTQMIQASNGEASDYFGTSIDMSSDGNTVAVGAHHESGPSNATADSGAVYVFEKSESGTWSETAILRANNLGAGDNLGGRVNISGNGLYIVAGARNEDTPHGNAGSVYVFRKDGTTWSQVAMLSNTDTSGGDLFGDSVCISSDGEVIAGGAVLDDVTYTDTGSAYIFRGTGAVTTSTTTTIPSSLKINDTIVATAFEGDGSALTGITSGQWTESSGDIYRSSGNVGIGVTDPPCKLTIDGGTGVNSGGGVLAIRQKGDTNNDGITLTSSHANSTRLYKDGNGHFNIYNTGGGSFTLENVTGNVGIGTTNPNENLEIYGDGIRIHDPDSSPKLDFVRGGTSRNPNTQTFGLSDYADWRITANGPKLNFQNQYTGGNSGNLLNVMTLEHDTGNVGVGVTDPNAKLHVNGNAIIGDIGANSALTHTDAQLTLGGTHNTGYNNNNQIKLLITGGNNDGSSPYYIMCEDENGFDQFYLKGATSEGGVNATMYLKGNAEISGYLKTGNPVFYARKTTGTAHNSYIIYNGVDVNIGSCYDSATGIFTCPVAGAYTFTWGTIAGTTDTVYRLHIRVNGNTINNTHLRADNIATGSEYSTGERTAILNLAANDEIRIFFAADDSTSSLYGSNYTYFQGHLISRT